MKKIRFGACLLLILMLVSLLTACDKRGSVERAFKTAGYDLTVIDAALDEEDRALLLKLFDKERVESLPDCRILVFSKYRIPGAAVFCFSSSGELRRYLNTQGGDAYKTARREGRVRGNCYLAYAGYGTLEIFTGK